MNILLLTHLQHQNKRAREVELPDMCSSREDLLEANTESASEGPQTFKVHFFYRKTRIESRFIRDADGKYPCVCDVITFGKVSAEKHLHSLTD